MKRLLGIHLGFALLAAASISQAATGYVCYAYYSPHEDGILNVQYNTLPHCGGSVLGVYNYCGTASTMQYCATAADDRYSTQELLVLLQILQRAGQDEAKVDFYTTSFCNNTVPCATAFRVRAD